MPPGLTTGRLKEGACFLTSLPRFATGRIQDGVTGRARSARIEGGPGPRARTTTPAGCQHRWIDHCHSTGSVPSSPHPACPPARPDEGVTKRGNRFRSRQPAAPTMTPGFAKLELDSRPSHRREGFVTTATGPSIDLLLEINTAFNSRDVDRIMAFFADDATFQMARGPEPCGRRVFG